MPKAVVEFIDHRSDIKLDLYIPLEITPDELFSALSERFHFPDDANGRYFQTQYPDLLLRGERTLESLGVRDGTIIHYSIRRK